MVHRSGAGSFWVLGLFLALGGACGPKDKPADKCSAKTMCSAGFKCEKKDGSPISGPLDVGECKPDPCTVTVPCEKPQPSQHPNDPCINDRVESCDVHDPNKFCGCVSTKGNQIPVPPTTGATPTTG